MALLKRFIMLAVLAAILASCSCPQRIERLRRHCPDCFRTATLQDTVVHQAFAFDTVALLGDYGEDGRGIVIEQRNFDLRIMIDGDTAHVALESTPDTVVINHSVEIPAEPCDEQPPWRERIIIIGLIIVIIGLTRLLFIK